MKYVKLNEHVRVVYTPKLHIYTTILPIAG